MPILVIKSCGECPFSFYFNTPFGGDYLCDKLDNKISDITVIEDLDDILDCCPLDLKDSEKK